MGKTSCSSSRLHTRIGNVCGIIQLNIADAVPGAGSATGAPVGGMGSFNMRRDTNPKPSAHSIIEETRGRIHACRPALLVKIGDKPCFVLPAQSSVVGVRRMFQTTQFVPRVLGPRLQTPESDSSAPQTDSSISQTKL